MGDGNRGAGRWEPRPPGRGDPARLRALLVEDSPEFVAVCQRLLEDEGFEVLVASDGASAIELARGDQLDLALLDLGLPDLDGVEVCRRIREFTDAYVVMVTARGGEADKVLGLMVGADDYVTKPFSPRELAARIQAMLRRPRTARTGRPRSFERLRIDPVVREVVLDGVPLELTRLEFEILDLLSAEPRATVSRERLLARVWGDDWGGDDHIIDVHVGNLRRKLRESASDPRHIRTVRGVGYRFEP